MKNLHLLLAACFLSTYVTAQDGPVNIRYQHAPQFPQSAVASHPVIADRKMPGDNAARTTTGPGGSRYYIHSYYLQGVLGLTLGEFFPYLWNDTTSVDSFTGGAGTVYQYNNLTSVGLSFDPYVSAANNPAYFPGQIAVGPTDAYTIDTVLTGGVYQRSYATAAKRQIIDTIRLAMVYGNGAAASDLPEYYFTGSAIHADYATDTLYYIDMAHDSLHNNANGGTVQHWDFILDSLDTSSSVIYSFPVSFAVPANNYVSMSFTFISGDHSFTPFDTVAGITTGTGYKYGMFRPQVIYVSDAAGDPLFPPYSVADQNIGFFKEDGIADSGWSVPDHYTPQWAYQSSTGGATIYQYPNFGFHVHCATCNVTNKLAVASLSSGIESVNAIPNPANSELNIMFTLSQAATATITLMNMAGEVVTVQHTDNAANGRVTFNTTDMPTGLYMYTLNANNERFTGKVVILH